MPAATAATFTGIHNENEFYSHHYLSEIFSSDIRATVDRWRDAADGPGGRTPYAALRALATDYVWFRRDFDRERRSERRLTLQREWFRQLLPALGYEWNPANHPLDDGDEVPVLCAAGGKAGAPALIALGAYDAEAEGEDPLAPKPHRLQFHGEAPPPEALLRETIEVKLSFNDEAQTAIGAQLADRYIPQRGASHGVYVVVWMSLPRPEELQAHRRPKWQSIESAREELRKEAERLWIGRCRPMRTTIT